MVKYLTNIVFCLTSELSWHVLTATYCYIIKVKDKGWKEMCSVGCIVTADSCNVWSFHLLCNGNKFSNPYSGKFVLYSVYVKASETTACPCIMEVLCSSQCAHVMKFWNMQFVFPFAPMLYVEMHSYRIFFFNQLSYMMIHFFAFVCAVLVCELDGPFLEISNSCNTPHTLK